jgi:hypothetical protein
VKQGYWTQMIAFPLILLFVSCTKNDLRRTQKESIENIHGTQTIKILTPMFTKGVIQVFKHLSTNKMFEVPFDTTAKNFKPVEISKDWVMNEIEVVVYGTLFDPISRESVEIDEKHAWHAMIPNNRDYSQIVVSPITEICYWKIPYPGGGFSRSDYENRPSEEMARNYDMISDLLNVTGIESVVPKFDKVKSPQKMTPEERLGVWIAALSHMAKKHAEIEQDNPEYYNLITLTESFSRMVFWNQEFGIHARDLQFHEQPAMHGKHKLNAESFRLSLLGSLHDFLSTENYSGLSKENVKSFEKSITQNQNRYLFEDRAELGDQFELDPPQIQWDDQSDVDDEPNKVFKVSYLNIKGHVNDHSPILKMDFRVVFDDGSYEVIRWRDAGNPGSFDGYMDIYLKYKKYKKTKLYATVFDVIGNKTQQIIDLEIVNR